MSRPLAVLRPEPGNGATIGRIEACGRKAISLPLFEVRPLDWTPPDPSAFDALFLTSANAPRMAGPGLAALTHLPVYAVGTATRDAAQARGLDVVFTGEHGGAELARAATRRGTHHGLLLSGREHLLQADGPIAQAIAVYASDPIPVALDELAALKQSVALLHSARAARRLGEVVDGAGISRSTVRIAAISAATADAAGRGWEMVAIAVAPDDPALIASALALAD